MIGVKGTNGVLKPRFALGCVYLITKIPADTRIKADKVPIFTSSAKMFKLMKPPAKAVTIPKNQVTTNGVFLLASTLLNTLGKSPSRAIE